MNYNQLENHNKNGVTVLKGLAAAPGYSIGPAYIYHREKIEVYPTVVLDTADELNSLQTAIERSKKELSKIISISREKIDERTAGIFEAHLLVLDDPLLFGTIEKNITEKRYSAEYSVDKEFNKYIELMKHSSGQSMLERAADIEDLKLRLIRNLQKKRWESRLTHSVIIFAHNLTPADTLLFSRNDVLAYVSEVGGLTSHAAIISRSLNIPAVVGIHQVISQVKNDDNVIVDGFNGYVIINPDEKLLKIYERKIRDFQKSHALLKDIKDLPAITLDGHKVKLAANIEFMEEVEYVITNGADGVGLYRTEELFFEREHFPTEAEQIANYNSLAEMVYPREVTIRTFDIGGDKILPAELKEDNPFLGWRGIRLLLDKPNILKEQFKAILISSLHKNIKIMVPMISSLEEITQAKEYLEEAKKELKNQNQRFDEKIKFGIMAEIPSVAFCINEIAKEVDFISVGSNDLLQYLLAVDRGNDIVSKYYKEFHPALLRILKTIVDESHKHKITVSICGEMASHFDAVPLLIGLGFNELSVSVYFLPEIKKLIRSISFKEAKTLADKCLKMNSHDDIQKSAQEFREKIK